MNLIKVNWFKFFINTNNISLPFLEGVSKEDLKELRIQNPDCTFLSYKDRVYFWGESELEEGKKENIDGNEKPYLLIKVFKEIFLDQFYNLENLFINKGLVGYTITDYRIPVLEGEYPYLDLYKNYHIHFCPLVCWGKAKFWTYCIYFYFRKA